MLVDISCFHNSSLDMEPNADLKFTKLHKENFWILRCISLLGVIIIAWSISNLPGLKPAFSSARILSSIQS